MSSVPAFRPHSSRPFHPFPFFIHSDSIPSNAPPQRRDTYRILSALRNNLKTSTSPLSTTSNQPWPRQTMSWMQSSVRTSLDPIAPFLCPLPII